MQRFNTTKTVLALVAGLLAVTALGGCARNTAGGDIPEPKNLAQETTEAALFYSTGRSLLEERKIIDAVSPYESTLKELLRALPEDNTDVAIVQPESEFNSVTLDEKTGVVTVDWKKEVLDFDAEPKEKRLAFASLLMTFGGFEEIKQVKFTVEGKTSGKIGDKDIEAFWGDVSLKGQPFDVMRPPVKKDKGEIMEEQLNGSQESTETDSK